MRGFYKTIKSQISSTKSQINHKFQYSMTKASATVVSNPFTSPGLPVMIQLDTTLEGLFVLNFKFGSLGIV